MSLRQWVGVVVLCAGLTAGASGCNSARMVRWDGATGVVAIPRNDNDWPTKNREHAEALMAQRCPQGYQIVNEEEVVVGQVQHTNVNTSQSGNTTLAAMHLDSVKTHTNETTTTEDKKEWRITFRPVGAPPVVQTGAFGPAPPPVIQTGAFGPAPPTPAGVITPPTPPGLPSQPVPIRQ